MKLTPILGNTRRPDIIFHKSGKIDISARVVRALSIHEGDIIDILTGEGEYYLFITMRASQVIGRHEGRCTPSKHGYSHFRAQSRRLCAVILNTVKSSENPDHAGFPAGEQVMIEGRKAITLITRNNLLHND